jgi:hypothetical protein
MATAMTSETKGETPDYIAMADVLEQIAREIRERLKSQTPAEEFAQAERLERIAAEIKSRVT